MIRAAMLTLALAACGGESFEDATPVPAAIEVEPRCRERARDGVRCQCWEDAGGAACDAAGYSVRVRCATTDHGSRLVRECDYPAGGEVTTMCCYPAAADGER